MSHTLIIRSGTVKGVIVLSSRKAWVLVDCVDKVLRGLIIDNQHDCDNYLDFFPRIEEFCWWAEEYNQFMWGAVPGGQSVKNASILARQDSKPKILQRAIEIWADLKRYNSWKDIYFWKLGFYLVLIDFAIYLMYDNFK